MSVFIRKRGYKSEKSRSSPSNSNMTHIISVSLSEEQYKFIKEQKLSPSKLIQDAITYLDSENVTSMLRHNKEIRAIKAQMINFIQEKGLGEEYSNYVLEKTTQ